ncbi:C-type lectin domain family 10 member A-like [Simochromis diagramma]|uniref:C-type lectin domain family 10 member A-like n=1 Tax=Simochromis diagramma TaxID=43689 RepID=UPI001A7F00E7|nr:C-type lectin domain family 10 member A-like [Simochromis diagramma]
MEESYYENYWDQTTLSLTDSPAPSSASRFRRWLFPGLIVVVLLILIIVMGSTNRKMSNRLGTLEQRVSNLSKIVQSLNASLHHTQETAKQVQQLQYAVENKDQFNSVSEAPEQLSAIDSLSKSIAAIKCSHEHVINNSSTTGGCCPVGWTVFESNCYFFSGDSRSWNESRDWCETQQAHLLILHNDKEWVRPATLVT